MATDEWAAVVLAGGRASRLGGIDKTQLVLDGVTLLDRVIGAVAGARSITVVGPDSLAQHLSARAGLSLVCERPRFGGPALALGTAIQSAPDDHPGWTAVFAADAVAVDRVLPRLLASRPARGSIDGIVGEDPAGRMQPLLGVYRTSSLRRAVRSALSSHLLDHLSLTALLSPLELQRLALTEEDCADIDTAEDASRYAVEVPELAAVVAP